jgi:hypothetical protein
MFIQQNLKENRIAKIPALSEEYLGGMSSSFAISKGWGNT